MKKEDLTTLSGTDEGKKLLLSLSYSLKSPRTKNNILFKYLENLQNKQNIDHLRLLQHTFTYTGTLTSILSVKAFSKYYVEYNNEYSTKRQRATVIHPRKPKYDEDFFRKIKKEDYMYGKRLGSAFLWCTNCMNQYISPHQIGVESGRHMVKFILPKAEYTLHRPTNIEGHGSRWYYGNILENEDWGCAIDISKISATSSENDIRGLPEALLETVFEQSYEVKYLGMEANTKEYHNEKYSVFQNNIRGYYNKDILEDIYSEYQKVK